MVCWCLIHNGSTVGSFQLKEETAEDPHQPRKKKRAPVLVLGSCTRNLGPHKLKQGPLANSNILRFYMGQGFLIGFLHSMRDLAKPPLKTHRACFVSLLNPAPCMWQTLRLAHAMSPRSPRAVPPTQNRFGLELRV